MGLNSWASVGLFVAIMAVYAAIRLLPPSVRTLKLMMALLAVVSVYFAVQSVMYFRSGRSDGDLLGWAWVLGSIACLLTTFVYARVIYFTRKLETAQREIAELSQEIKGMLRSSGHLGSGDDLA